MSTDAATGYSAVAGWRIGLQYDFIDQNQLRTGTRSVSAADLASINDAGGEQEVEKQTINRYLTLGISYSPNPDWNVSTLIPYIDRSHTTYGAATTDQLTPDQISASTSTGLGDVKLIVNYQGFLPTHNLGLQLGVKLPTGNYGGQNVETGEFVGRNPVVFSSGPNAGSALDTSLNVGTGSTDLIVGAYYYQAISQDFDAFVNAQFQAAVAHRLDQANADYRPGNQTSFNFGVRYEANPNWVPQVQVNTAHKSHDQGALADIFGTGGTVVYVSPGITAVVARNMSAYAFLQVPAYSKLEGFQLFPKWTGSVGLSYAF
ncbi:MAG TPA: hypothetical protein VFE23_22045 [Usitatibacter sp.]|nr:hypothetical protein [Usitatibacter sp.]